MPSPETIKAKLMQLHILSEWDRPSRRMSDRETKVWEGTEQGGHFHFHGHEGFLWDPETGDNIFAIGYTLSITGTDKCKEAISADFIAVLGPPRRDFRGELRQALGKRAGKITYLTWFQPKDEREENKPSYVLLVENYVEAYILDCVPRDDDLAHPRHRNILPPK